MGGGGSHHVEYDNSAVIAAQNRLAEQQRVAAENERRQRELEAQLAQERQRAEQERQRAANAAAAAAEAQRQAEARARVPKTEAQLFEELLQQLQQNPARYRSGRSTSGGVVKVGMLGKTSVGKSTAINARFGEQRAKASAGTTTREVSCVGTLTSAALPLLGRVALQVFDFPGDETAFNYRAEATLQRIGEMDLVVVLFNSTTDYIVPIVRIAHALGVATVVARSFIDNIGEDDDLSWPAQVATDLQDLRARVPAYSGSIFAISGRRAFEREKQLKKLRDNPALSPAPIDVYQWDDLWTRVSQTAVDISRARGGA